MKNNAEQIMLTIWKKILTEMRRMRDEKHTLERIGAILGVSKPTVQRWLESEAGGEKTAFIDVLRYVQALKIDLKPLLFPEEGKHSKSAARETASTAELTSLQRELLQSREKVIALQDRLLKLEQHNAESTAKAMLTEIRNLTEQQRNLAGQQRRVAPHFPDLPPIHLPRR